MKQALVVKALTDQIILARMDNSDLVSLSVPCGTISPGILLSFDADTTGCPVYSVNGENCKTNCRRQNYVMIIEHKDKVNSALITSNQDSERHVI